MLKQTIWLQLNLNSQPMPRLEPGTPDHDLFITSSELDHSAMGPGVKNLQSKGQISKQQFLI